MASLAAQLTITAFIVTYHLLLPDRPSSGDDGILRPKRAAQVHPVHGSVRGHVHALGTNGIHIQLARAEMPLSSSGARLPN